MNMTIRSEKENPLLKRKEVIAEVSHPGKPTPVRSELIASLAATLKTKNDLIIVDKILTKGGIASCTAKVLVYSKKEDIPKEKLEKQERRMNKKKPGEEKEEKPAEKPKAKEEPKKEEKPKEEKPEEKKEEPKKEDKPEAKEEVKKEDSK